MKYNFLLLLLLFFCGNYCFAQQYGIGHQTISLMDTSRNRTIQTELYYPADSSGENVPFATSTTEKFPVLVFGHGFVMTWDAYRNIWEAAVPHGYILAFPLTETGISPQHLELGKDLAFLVDAIKMEGSNTGSFFYDRVDSSSCVMGHSMGGGASFLALQFNPGITAIANLAAAETSPSAIEAAASISIPSLLFAGENDCVTPPATNQILMFDSLPSACKTLVTIRGGSHCQMADNNFLCSIGENSCTPAPTISRIDQHATIDRFLIPWLNFQLKGNCADGARFDSLAVSDPAVLFSGNCQLCTSTTTEEIDAKNFYSIGPNPVHDFLQIRFSETVTEPVLVKISDMLGKNRYSELYTGARTIDLTFSNLENGMYFISLETKNYTQLFKALKY